MYIFVLSCRLSARFHKSTFVLTNSSNLCLSLSLFVLFVFLYLTIFIYCSASFSLTFSLYILPTLFFPPSLFSSLYPFLYPNLPSPSFLPFLSLFCFFSLSLSLSLSRCLSIFLSFRSMIIK